MSHGHELVFGVFSPDGSQVLTASQGPATLWLLDRSPQVGFLAEASVEDSPEESRPTSSSAGGSRSLRISREDHSVQVLEADGTDGRLIHGQAGVASLSPSGSKLASVSYEQRLQIWDAEGEAQPVEQPEVDESEGWSIIDVSFSPDETRVVTTSNFATATVWKTEGGEPPIELPTVNAEYDLNADAPRARAMFSPDGSLVLISSSDGVNHLWSADGTGESVVLRGPARFVSGLNEQGQRVPDFLDATFSPDGSRVVVAGSHMWRLRDELARELWTATTYCVEPGMRTRLLGESQDEAREAYNRCTKRVECLADLGAYSSAEPVDPGPCLGDLEATP
jgi:WD40 repeat protein